MRCPDCKYHIGWPQYNQYCRDTFFMCRKPKPDQVIQCAQCGIHYVHTFHTMIKPLSYLVGGIIAGIVAYVCLLYTSPSPRDQRGSRMPSSA